MKLRFLNMIGRKSGHKCYCKRFEYIRHGLLERGKHMENFTVNIKIKLNITQEDIDDIVRTALEGGIGDWCRKVEVKGDYLGEYASDQISRNGILKLYGYKTDEFYLLTRDRLLKGIVKYCKNVQNLCDIIYVKDNPCEQECELDCSMIDSVAADMIIQYAVMGDVIYV